MSTATWSKSVWVIVSETPAEDGTIEVTTKAGKSEVKEVGEPTVRVTNEGKVLYYYIPL